MIKLGWEKSVVTTVASTHVRVVSVSQVGVVVQLAPLLFALGLLGGRTAVTRLKLPARQKQ